MMNFNHSSYKNAHYISSTQTQAHTCDHIHQPMHTKNTQMHTLMNIKANTNRQTFTSLLTYTKHEKNSLLQTYTCTFSSILPRGQEDRHSPFCPHAHSRLLPSFLIPIYSPHSSFPIYSPHSSRTDATILSASFFSRSNRR